MPPKKFEDFKKEIRRGTHSKQDGEDFIGHVRRYPEVSIEVIPNGRNTRIIRTTCRCFKSRPLTCEQVISVFGGFIGIHVLNRSERSCDVQLRQSSTIAGHRL